MQRPWLRLIGPPVWFHTAGDLRFAPERPYQLMSLLAYRGDWLSREGLANLFWPGHAADAARRNLRKVLFRLREMPGMPWPEESAGALRWQVPTDLQHLNAETASRDVATVAAAFGQCPFDGMDGDSGFAEWLQFERRRLRDGWRRTLLTGILHQADTDQALSWARLLREQDPLDEEALRAELQALLQAGRPADARLAYEAFEAQLQRELATRPDVRTRALAARWQANPAQAPPARRTAFDSPTLIGRETELRHLIRQCTRPGPRWITLMGPGGIGKTSLAQAVVQAASEGEARLVQAQDLLQAQALPERIAHTLGLGADARSFEGLAHALQGAPRLLVLDNLEQVEGLPTWAKRLLAAVPGLQVLATSRRRLGVESETVIELGGLPYPEPEDLAEAARFDAVRLFVRAVERHRADFDLAREQAAVSELCRAVEGWPLALELCAAWTPRLSVAEIVRNLRQGQADVLQLPAANGSRHENLPHILHTGWQGLQAHEQAALARLALLEEPCSSELACAVSGASLALLTALADRAWLRHERTGGAESRWGLHALVRRFLAQASASRTDWAAAANEALCAEMAQRAARVPPSREGAAHEAALDALAPDLPALVQAWRAAVQSGSVDRLDPMQMPLARLLLRQRRADGQAVFEAAEPVLQGQALARAWVHLAMFQLHASQAQQAIASARKALRMLLRGQDRAAVLQARQALGQGLLLAGQWQAADRVLDQGRALARELGNAHAESHLLDMASGVAYARGDHRKQVALLEQAIALARAHGGCPIIAYGNLGNAYRAQGRTEEAEASFRCGLGLAAGARWRRERATLLLNLGLLLGDRHGPGDREQALLLAQQGLQAAGDGVDVRIEIYLLGLLAGLQLQAGELAPAASSLHRALAGARRLNLLQAQLWLLPPWAEWLQRSHRPRQALAVLDTMLAHPAVQAADAEPARRLHDTCSAEVRAAPATAAHHPTPPRDLASLIDHLLTLA